MATTSTWLHALGSTALISIAPVLILFLIPVDGTAASKPLRKVLLAFASGGLLGDAFLHLIPHAIIALDDYGSASHHHHHGHSHGGGEFGGHDLSVGLWTLAGIVLFLFIEKMIRIAQGGHGHSHAPEDGAAPSTSPSTSSSTGRKGAARKEIQVAGYLNLAADFTHNFTDGLALGATYLAGASVGIVTTVAVLIHEIPHEIGDFAILIQSGYTRKEAMLLQLATATGGVAGTIVALIAGGWYEATTTWILPFTAGGFIYIATVSVIPELLRESTLKQSIFEGLAFAAGVAMMAAIAIFE